MTATFDSQLSAPAAAFGHRLAPPGDPLEGEGFERVYEAKIKPELAKCEAARQGAMRLFLLAVAAGAVALVLEFAFLGGRVPAITYIGTGVLAFGLGYGPLAKVAREAKVAVLQALCGPLGVTYSLTGAEPASWPDYGTLRLLPHHDTRHFEDFFSGRRGASDFSLCEARLVAGSGKSRREVFRGQLFCVTLPRARASTTVVLRNAGSGWVNRFEAPSGLREVGLEDPVFNKAFCVFGSDQVEAREILTPTFMQRLVDLEAAYAGKHLRCAFEDSRLLIAIEGQDRFEIGSMFSSLEDPARVEGIARDLEQVFKTIDEFQAA
ncbi:MAG TPA: DUF3137 domain-containing protein [Caulobacteraceae bacterium]|jgi:hypothetical protein